MNGRTIGTEIATDERDVAFTTLHFALVGNHAELAVARLDAGLAGADDVALVAQAVADQLGDGEDSEAVFAAKGDEVGNAGHLAVVAHDLADHTRGVEPRHAGQIDRSLGLPGANQHPAAPRAQRENVTGAGEIGGGRARVESGADGVGSVGGGNSRGNALAGLDGLGKRSAEARGILLRHGKEAQMIGALLGKREADEAATVARHKVDGLGGDVLGGQRKVALVLAVFVVDHDHHAAGTDFIECAGNVGKGRRGAAGSLGHSALLFSLIHAGNAKKGMHDEGEVVSELPVNRPEPRLDPGKHSKSRFGW